MTSAIIKGCKNAMVGLHCELVVKGIDGEPEAPGKGHHRSYTHTEKECTMRRSGGVATYQLSCATWVCSGSEARLSHRRNKPSSPTLQGQS